ncbi:MAG TPA: 1,4-dihydroxy-6-naphthoate synthase [Saprospiraceae bacterium]|nr:1,4-dihydroxy-6-naphthoate synthase [Saprospiraceae bacterium]
MKISIGISPCPNDTFIFEALIQKRIDTGPFDLHFVFEDVETLNRLSVTGHLDVTKLSLFAFALVSKNYQLLDSGSALGKNCGPLIIAKEPVPISDIQNCSISVPGERTTAHWLLQMAHPQLKQKEFTHFSEIENKVLQSITDLGLIIHENRFTYRDKGLHKVQDLGEFWESFSGLPLPLGGIAIRRDADHGRKQKINQLIRESIEFAFEHPQVSLPFIQSYAQEMEENVIKDHINLYVNEYSKSLQKEGKQAIMYMLHLMESMHMCPKVVLPIFI